MKINCETAVQGPLGGIPVPPCGKPAVILIVFRLENNGWNDTALGGLGCCAEHAAEEAFETRTSMDEDEYLIVNLEAGPTLEKVCADLDWASGGAPMDATQFAEETLARHLGGALDWDNSCGHRDAMLGPCVCGDKANHEPGGKYHTAVTS